MIDVFPSASQTPKLSEAAQAALQRTFQEGCIIILSIGKKSWSTKLTPDLLGLDALPPACKGRWDLLQEESDPENPEEQDLTKKDPAAKISSIEGKARNYLRKQSLSFGNEARANFRFVRTDMMIDTLLSLQEFKKQYFDAVDELILALPAIKENLKLNKPKQWEKLKDFYDVGSDFIKKQYYFVYESMAMAFPKALDSMDIEDLLRRQTIEGRVTDEYRAKAELVLREQSMQAKETAKGFVEDTIRAIRGQAVKAFQEIGAKIQKGDALNKKNIEKIREAVQYVKRMDFLGDRDFVTHMSNVENMLDGTSTFKDNDQAVAELDKILKQTVAFVGSTTDSAVASMTESYFARNLSL
jgi:hypothetical protein